MRQLRYVSLKLRCVSHSSRALDAMSGIIDPVCHSELAGESRSSRFAVPTVQSQGWDSGTEVSFAL